MIVLHGVAQWCLIALFALTFDPLWTWLHDCDQFWRIEVAYQCYFKTSNATCGCNLYHVYRWWCVHVSDCAFAMLCELCIVRSVDLCVFCMLHTVSMSDAIFYNWKIVFVAHFVRCLLCRMSRSRWMESKEYQLFYASRRGHLKSVIVLVMLVSDKCRPPRKVHLPLCCEGEELNSKGCRPELHT